MPIISRFYGIAIVMYFNDHNPPHLHAKYSGDEALFDFNGKVLEGSLPRRAALLVRDWISLHETELAAKWRTSGSNRTVGVIDMIHVTAVKYVREKIVWLSFDDGAAGEVDLTDHLVGSVFEPLRDTEEFKKVTYSKEIETIVWPNGADFAPEFLRGLLNQQASDIRSA